MNANISFLFKIIIPAGLLSFMMLGCERDLEELEPATYPVNPEVFIDDFSAGLNYAAFGGSVPTAFDIDKDVTYNNSSSAMRFDVPDAGDPRGAYAGGSFFTQVGRDLTGYNALTFWVKATKSASLDVVGFGNDLGANKYLTSLTNIPVTTSWKKFIIPIPDPSRLTAERGMFFYSEGPEEGKGYTFWIDEVKFEKLGTIAHPRFSILNGNDQVETSFIGVAKTITGLTATYNLPVGIDQAVNAAPSYFRFTSSNPSIATINDAGQIAIVGGPGNTKITATMAGITADGSLTIQSMGAFEHAPAPVHDPGKVISIFSDAYNNVPVNYYNGYWAPYQTTQSADFEVEGDHVLHYTNFNFVGIEFTTPTVDASAMTHLHLDIFIPNTLASNAQFKIEILDFGTTTTGANITNISTTQALQWISLNIPLSAFSGLSSKSTLGQIIFVNENSAISSFYADNIYFYNDGTVSPVPTTAAPTPTHDPAKVTAVYSDAYTMIPGTDFFPGWGQATVATQVQIQGNNTLKYAGLNYQGIQLGSSQNVSTMDYLHLDFYAANSTALSVFLISPGPVEKAYVLTVPTAGWTSLNIPLSSFAPVNLSDVFQLKFEGNGDIYLDNIYFHKN